MDPGRLPAERETFYRRTVMTDENTQDIQMDDEEHISHKIVKRLPMTRLEYNNFRKWDLPVDENGADPGYLVEYLYGGEPNVSGFEGYVSWSPKKQFDDGCTLAAVSEKSLNTADQDGCRKNVTDVVIFGEDLYKLLSKASSKREGWMKSSKAMETPNGCVVQVTTQQRNFDGTYSLAEALTFVPHVKIIETKDEDGAVTGRRLM